MARKDYRGAYRTATWYLLIVMGGTLLGVMPVLTLFLNWDEESHGHSRSSGLAIWGQHLGLFLVVAVSPLVLGWLVIAGLIYACALSLQKLKVTPLVSCLILACFSAYLSSEILFLISPSGWPSVGAVFLARLGVGFVGGAFGLFMYPRICQESFQTGPLGRGYKMLGGAWALLIILSWGYLATALIRVRIMSAKDPQVDLVFVKWSPAEGEIREEIDKYTNYPVLYLKDFEVQELRSAGLTGVLRGTGGYDYGPKNQAKRMVVIYSRPIRETIDLRKPASGDILYLQTEQGWKVFPPSAPTVARTLRFFFLDPTPTNSVATTYWSLDSGLGHPKETPSSYAFSWLPEEFEAPLPSLPD
jgi:hypothetical protein